MPILRITKNGDHLCTVGSDDVWAISASIWGDIWGPDTSFLMVNGSGKPVDGGNSDFLVWEMSHELEVGDRVRFLFEDGSTSSPSGRLLEGEPPPPGKTDFFSPPDDDEIRRFESRPVQNPNLVWHIAISGEAESQVNADTDRQNLSLSVLWSSHRPDRLRVRYSKSSLREIVARERGEEFAKYLSIGSCVEVAIIATGK